MARYSCSCVAGDECWPEVSELARETFPEIWPQFAQQTGAANKLRSDFGCLSKKPGKYHSQVLDAEWQCRGKVLTEA